MKCKTDTDENNKEDSHALLGFSTFLGSPEKMNSLDDTVIYNQYPNQQQKTTNSDSMTDFEKSKGNAH